MSIYYPAGSMRGSGIYATSQPYDAECAAWGDGPHNECGWHGTTDLDINDWGQGLWECPRCGTLHDAEPIDPREYQ